MTEQEAKEIEQSDPPKSGSEEEHLLAEASAVELEEKARLQQLVEVSIGLKPAKPELPPADPDSIEHITTNQIKTMRQVSAQRINQKEPLSTQIIQGIIKAYFDVIAMFTFAPPKPKERCAVHECAHCGQKFPTIDANSGENK